jgi:hypothetical protein
MAYSSTLKMETTCSSELSVDFQQIIWQYITSHKVVDRTVSSMKSFRPETAHNTGVKRRVVMIESDSGTSVAHSPLLSPSQAAQWQSSGATVRTPLTQTGYTALPYKLRLLALHSHINVSLLRAMSLPYLQYKRVCFGTVSCCVYTQFRFIYIRLYCAIFCGLEFQSVMFYRTSHPSEYNRLSVTEMKEMDILLRRMYNTCL